MKYNWKYRIIMGLDFLHWPPGPKSFISNGYKEDVVVTRHTKDVTNPSVVRVAAGQKFMFYGCKIVVSITSVDGENLMTTSNYEIPHSKSLIIAKTGGVTMSKWFNHWKTDDGVCHKR